MRKTPKEAFTEWFDAIEEQDMYDVTGVDWDDQLLWTQECFEAGWDAALQNLTTKDI